MKLAVHIGQASQLMSKLWPLVYPRAVSVSSLCPKGAGATLFCEKQDSAILSESNSIVQRQFQRMLLVLSTELSFYPKSYIFFSPIKCCNSCGHVY